MGVKGLAFFSFTRVKSTEQGPEAKTKRQCKRANRFNSDVNVTPIAWLECAVVSVLFLYFGYGSP
jgi:hypothetical protein